MASSNKEVALARAKNLRGQLKPAEQRLWYHLRGHRFLGVKFKRQKPIGPYIADFVCVHRRLVIEVDGGQHDEHTRTHDEVRAQWLRNQGYAVLRFWNNEVLGNTEGVLQKIELNLSPGVPSPGADAPPSPASGRGDAKGH